VASANNLAFTGKDLRCGGNDWETALFPRLCISTWVPFLEADDVRARARETEGHLAFQARR
jgi:hypothetical protein